MHLLSSVSAQLNIFKQMSSLSLQLSNSNGAFLLLDTTEETMDMGDVYLGDGWRIAMKMGAAYLRDGYILGVELV